MSSWAPLGCVHVHLLAQVHFSHIHIGSGQSQLLNLLETSILIYKKGKKKKKKKPFIISQNNNNNNNSQQESLILGELYRCTTAKLKLLLNY